MTLIPTLTVDRKLKLIRFAGLLLAVLTALTIPAWSGHAAQGFAGSPEERAVLARLANELEALKPLINEARRASAQPSGRFRFNYDAMLNDLRTMENGIRQMLAQPDTTPREYPPLAGSYLQ